MITPMQMYWLVTLNSIVTVSGIIAVVIGIIAFISVAIVLDDTLPPWMTIVLGVVAIFFAMVAAFTPSTKQMAAIILVPKIANNEKVQTVGNKLYDLAVEWMDELRPNRDGSKEEK